MFRQSILEVISIMQKRILIVDDEVFTLRMMEKKLSNYDCIVDTASNSHDAIDKINNQKYDAIILDVNMPDITGIEILKMKNSTLSELNRKTPAIMCSSSVDYEVVSSAMEHKAFDYIIKSFHFDRLTEIIDSIDSFAKVKSSQV
jgi:DNA-binding NtrC family response regulator